MNKIICKSPLVSIVMSVYKPDLPLLKKSINSILSQTYKNIEVIIVNDGMDSQSEQFLENVVERKTNTFLIKNETNLGLTKSLNIAINSAKGILIARNDADDVSNPHRIEKQVEFFISTLLIL